jgi:hypothetical protein
VTFFFENPVAILVMGGLTLAIIAGGWYQTQRRELVIAFVAALVIFGGLLVLERFTITDGEAVRATIHTIAREAEANDADALVRRFHSSASRYVDQLRAELLLYEIKKVSVKNNLKVTVDRRHQPPQAVATFNVVVVGGDRVGAFGEMTVPRFVTATFWLEDGEWRCVDYKHEDVQIGMKKKMLDP